LAKRIIECKDKTLVHCIAGRGRSGTLAATVLAFEKVRQGNRSSNVVLESALEIRKRRDKTIQTKEQYASIYPALEILLQQTNPLTKSWTSIYEEFDELEETNPVYRDRFFSHDSCLDDSLILSEAPRIRNIEQFIELITEVGQVVMLMQRKDFDADFYPYFEDKGIAYTFQHTVERKNVEEIGDGLEKSTLVIKKLKAEKGREVLHYHYKNWVDMEPCNPLMLAKLASLIYESKKRTLIHCMMGRGRTGVLACTLAALKKIKGGDSSYRVVPEALTEIRKKRQGAVFTHPQYSCIYQALKILDGQGYLKKEVANTPSDQKIDRHGKKVVEGGDDGARGDGRIYADAGEEERRKDAEERARKAAADQPSADNS
jgi:protein tyrosine phosphatase